MADDSNESSDNGINEVLINEVIEALIIFELDELVIVNDSDVIISYVGHRQCINLLGDVVSIENSKSADRNKCKTCRKFDAIGSIDDYVSFVIQICVVGAISDVEFEHEDIETKEIIPELIRDLQSSLTTATVVQIYVKNRLVQVGSNIL